MKQLYSFLFCIAALSLVSCEKMLESDPQSYLPADKVTNAATINNTVLGCYSGMQAPLDYEWMLIDLRSDDALQGQPNSSTVQNYAYNDLDMFRPSPSLEQIYDYWKACYHNISNANNVIQNVNKLDPTATLLQYKGEALFIRSYHYFNLVRLFGPIFLVTETIQPSEAKKLNRQPVDLVYAQLVADLEYAIENLPATYPAADLGRATKWAAQALLAKVYLSWAGTSTNYLVEADQLLDELQQAPATGSIGLESDYAKIFDIKNEMNKEIVFAIRFKTGGYGLGSKFANMFAPLNSQMTAGGCQGLNNPSMSIYSAYKASGDTTRQQVSMGHYDKTNIDSMYVKKFFSVATLGNDAENDWPVLRYADVLLMSAEVKARLGNVSAGLSRLNTVRTRAKLPSLTISSLAEFMEAIQLERRLEFAFENQRFFDLVRWGIAGDVLTNDIYNVDWTHYSRFPQAIAPRNPVDQWRLLLPIPQHEIDTNNETKIPQNYGY